MGNACHGIALDCALCATDQYVCVYEYVKLHQFLANAIFMVVWCHGHLSPSSPWPQQSAVNAGQAISYLAPWPPCSENPGKEQEKTDKFSIWQFGRKKYNQYVVQLEQWSDSCKRAFYQLCQWRHLAKARGGFSSMREPVVQCVFPHWRALPREDQGVFLCLVTFSGIFVVPSWNKAFKTCLLC